MTDGWTNRSRRGLCSGDPIRWRALVAVLIGLVVCGSLLRADDESSQPASDGHLWPEGYWIPVPRELFRQFLSQRAEGGDALSPAGPFIERAVYRGDLQDDLSFRGDFDAAIQPVDSNSVLNLQQVSLYLGDLQWEDRPAAWGTDDNGQSVLLIPSSDSTLAGRWSLTHRVVGERIEFRVQAPPAASSRFELSLPTGWILDSSVGTVFPPAENGTGTSTWVVELGRRHECLWTLRRDDSPQSSPLMLTDRSLVYSVGTDHCQIHAGFSTRLLRGPVQEFRFVLPEGFQYTKTTYDRTIPLAVRLEQRQGMQILIVPVPELSPGLLRTIEIDGTMPSVLNELWQLPAISLQDARMRRSTRRLRVEVPLAVSILEPTQLRQTDATFNESGVDWFFEELNDDSDLAVQLVTRRPRISVRVASQVDEEPGDLRCDTLVRLHTQSGTWYATDFRLPSDWEIFDVVPSAGVPNSAISYWRVFDQEDGQRLRVEFQQAASLQSPKSILIRSRVRRSDSPQESWAAPIPVPVEPDDCRVLLVVDRDYSLSTVSTEQPAWTETQRSAVEGAWSADLDALDVTVANDHEFRFFESARAFEAEGLAIQRVVERDSDVAVPQHDAPPPTNHSNPSTVVDVPRRPTLALRLRSHLSAGAGDSDWHEAIFDVIAGQCSESMSFGLVSEFSLGSVLVDGEPAVYSRQDNRIELTDLAPDVRAVEIHYSRAGAAPAWLSHRNLQVVPPESDQAVVGFQWEVRIPRGYGISHDPSLAALSSHAQDLSLTETILGPFFRFPSSVRRRVNTPPEYSRNRAGHANDDSHPLPVTDLATFAAISPPDFLAIELWNIDVVRGYAWVVFLGTALVVLLIRRVGRRYWFLRAVAAMFVSAMLAATLATVPALLCGSVFLGIVVAVLMPRRLTGFRSANAPSSDSSGLPSHDRVAWTAGSLVVATSFLTHASFGEADDDPPPDRARMLVPYLDGEAGNVVYVDAELARELAEWQSADDSQPRSLLRGARYFVSADANQRIRAELDVLVPADAARVPVRLEFEGVTFRSSDDCLVDGVPTPLSPATDGRGLIVEVINHRTDPPIDDDIFETVGFRSSRLTLEFRPRINESGTGREAKLPVIIDSRLILEGFDLGNEIPQVIRAGASRKQANVWEVELGPVGELGINTGLTETPSTQQTQANRAVSLIELRPGHARVQTQLELHRPPGAFGLDPSMPHVIELAGLCDVQEVASKNLQAYYVRYRDSDRTLVELVFAQFDADESLVHFDYTRPPSVDGQWRFPDLLLVDNAPLTEHLVGVTSSRGFLIDTDNAVADAEDVRVVTPATFVDLVPEDRGWLEPDVAYQLTPPVFLPIRLDRLGTERSIGIEQIVSISDDRMTWRAELSMNVVGAPATQHRVELSSSVQVESVSVLQDGAERLLSWSQDDKSLVIFLTGDREGVQEIRLQGHCTTGEGPLQEVPTIRIPAATIGKSETVIENQSGQMVELLDSRGVLTGMLTPADDSETDDLSRSQFDADDTSAPAHFRVQPRRTALSLEALVAVSTAQIAVGFRPAASTTGVHEWDLVIPDEWGDRFHVAPPAVVSRQRTDPAGETVLSFRTESADDILTLVAPASQPDSALWMLPLPTVRGADVARSYVAVAPGVLFEVDAVDDAGVEPDPVWQSWLGFVLDRQSVRMTPSRLEECTLKRRVEEGSRAEASTLLAETLLFSNMGSPSDARTSVTVMSREREFDLEFSVPEDVELLSAEFRHQLVVPELTDRGTAIFRVASDGPVGLSRFVLNWQSNTPSASGRVTESLPRLKFPPPECEVILVIPEADRQYVVRDGITARSHREYHFSRAESLYGILEHIRQSQIDLDTASRTVTADIAAQLLLHLATLEHERLDANQTIRLTALQAEWEGIRSAMEAEWEEPAIESIARLPPESWEVSSSEFVLVDAGGLAGTPDSTMSRMSFVVVSPVLVQGISTAAVLSGILAALALLRSIIPASWRQFWERRDTLVGLALLGLLWWALLPLGQLGLAVGVIAVICETGSILRGWNGLRHAV